MLIRIYNLETGENFELNEDIQVIGLMLEHEWKAIEGSDCIISENGIVVNVKTNTIINSREINGVLMATFYRNGKRSSFSIAKMVAEIYVPNPYNYHFVKHYNMDKKFNHYSNLYWSKICANG